MLNPEGVHLNIPLADHKMPDVSSYKAEVQEHCSAVAC